MQGVQAHMDVGGVVVQSSVKIGSFLLRPGADSLGQIFAARALFQYNEWAWTVKVLPHCLQLAPHTVSKKGGDVGAGIEVTLPAHTRLPADIVAVAGLVECHTHIFRESNRTLTLNTFYDDSL